MEPIFGFLFFGFILILIGYLIWPRDPRVKLANGTVIRFPRKPLEQSLRFHAERPIIIDHYDDDAALAMILAQNAALQSEQMIYMPPSDLADTVEPGIASRFEGGGGESGGGGATASWDPPADTGSCFDSSPCSSDSGSSFDCGSSFDSGSCSSGGGD